MAASTKAKPPTSKNPHHDDGDFQHPHLTRGEHRPWQWRIVGLARDRHRLETSCLSQSKAPALKRLTAEADASHDGQRLDRFLSDAPA